MPSGKFHHFGVPTTIKQENELFIEEAKVSITDPESHPYRVEFLRFEAESPMHEVVRNNPHAAFIVENLDEALRGRDVVVEPFDATEELRAAFIMDGNALIEIMEKR